MTNGTNTETYTYDAVGNRTMSGYTTGAFNRLTAANSQTYNYDANGSRYRKSDTDYGWDRENRLVSTTNWDAMHYNYDALGRRVSSHFVPFLVSTDDPPPTRFTYDGPDVILDDNSGQQTTSIVNYQNAPGIDNKLALTNNGRWNYLLQDHLGSTVGLTDNSGNVAETNSYGSFGNPSNSNFPTRYQFTGREFDSFSGLQYSRARFYDPQIGRFISEDPIGFRGGDMNLYGYVGNNPVSEKDPRGLTWRSNLRFLFDFTTGTGDTNRTYQPGSDEMNEFQNSPGVAALRNSYYSQDCNSISFGYSTGAAARDTLTNPYYWNDTAFQVGGFQGSATNIGNGTVEIRVGNVAGARSFFYHRFPNFPDGGPFRSIYQDFHWREQINLCECKKYVESTSPFPIPLPFPTAGMP